MIVYTRSTMEWKYGRFTARQNETTENCGPK